MTKRVMATCLAAVAIGLLAGCGGDDSTTSGSGGTPTPSSTTSPTPSPSSTVYPPAPFGITDAQEFDLIGWRLDGEELALLDQANYAFGWGKSPDTYRLSMPQLADGYLVYTYPGDNSFAFTVNASDGTETTIRASVSSSVKGPNIAFQYIGSLYLADHKGEMETGLANALFGLATPASAIPTEGSRTYRFDAASNPFNVTIDFSTGEVTGLVPLAWSDAWGPYQAILYDIEDGLLDTSSGEVSGIFTVPGQDPKGTVRGRLMGPSADEFALIYAGPVYNPYTQGYDQLPFVAAGKYCSTC